MSRFPELLLDIEQGRMNLRRPESVYYVGVDVGQARDPSTVAVVERAEVAGEWDAVNWCHVMHREYRLRYLERVALGTPYPEVVERVGRVVAARGMTGRRHVAVDATGVGRPVVELLKRAGLGCGISAVTITGGDVERYVDGFWRVPKTDLIVGLQVMLQMGELEIAEGLRDGPALVRELSEMRVSEEDGWRSGPHDDLVFAVALATWAARGGK